MIRGDCDLVAGLQNLKQRRAILLLDSIIFFGRLSLFGKRIIAQLGHLILVERLRCRAHAGARVRHRLLSQTLS